MNEKDGNEGNVEENGVAAENGVVPAAGNEPNEKGCN